MSLRHRPVTLAISVLLIGGTYYLFTLTPIGFLPSEDQGRFGASTEAIQGIGYDEMLRHQMMAADLLARDPNIHSFGAVVGGFGVINQGRFNIDLKPRDQR